MPTAASRQDSPSRVRPVRRVVRFISRAPSRSSIRARRRLAAEGDTPSLSAVPVKLPCRASRTKKGMSLSALDLASNALMM